MKMMVPRDYQIYAARFLASRSGAILADDMGSGKSLSTILAWKHLGLKGPVLLIARPNTQSVWLRQAPMAGIQTPFIISGQKKQRNKEWEDIDQYSFVASTIEAIRYDIKDTRLAKVKWKLIIVEEAHRYCNRKTAAWKLLRELRKNSEHIIFITGSPMRRGFQDLWALLHLCDHKRWSSYWKYIETFGITQTNEWGANEILGIRDKQVHAKAISPYFLRRTMEEVAPEVPKKTRILDHVLEMTQAQQKMYDQINEEMLLELQSGDLVIAQNSLVKLTRLRQILCCPKILDPGGDWGASLQHFKELVEETSDNDHYVLFTPYVSAIPHIKEFLLNEVKLSEYEIHLLQGGITAQELNQRIDKFQQLGGCMVCSIAFAESFDLVPAKWAYFLGFSFDPFQNLQAEDRLRRLITTYPTFFYYPTHQNCIDSQLVLEACNDKVTEILKVYSASSSVLRRLLMNRKIARSPNQ